MVHKIGRKTREIRIQQAKVQINPPLLWIHDRGNGYILRKKIEGIHWEEAVYQLKQNPELRFLNEHLFLDQKLAKVIRETMNWIKAHIRVPDPSYFQDLAYFVPWNLEKNRPLFSIDNANAPYLEKIWVA